MTSWSQYARAMRRAAEPFGPYDQPDAEAQSFDAYVREHTARRDQPERALRVFALGPLHPAQRAIAVKTVAYVCLVLRAPVAKIQPLSLDLVPAELRRALPGSGGFQIFSPYVLRQVLPAHTKHGAIATIAVTAVDLWPRESWNFAFGQSNRRRETAIWSLARNGDPGAMPEALVRSLKTATHETCHALGLRHCAEFHCVMNASGGMEDRDEKPLALCPTCACKVCWRRKMEPRTMFGGLEDFAEVHGLREHAAHVREILGACG